MDRTRHRTPLLLLLLLVLRYARKRVRVSAEVPFLRFYPFFLSPATHVVPCMRRGFSALF